MCLWNQTIPKPSGFLCILNVHVKLPFIQIHTVTMLRRFKVQNIKYTYKFPFIQIHTVTMLRHFKVQNIKYTY